MRKGSLTTHDVTVRVPETIRIYHAAPDELKSGNARSTRWKDGEACSDIIGCVRLQCSLNIMSARETRKIIVSPHRYPFNQRDTEIYNRKEDDQVRDCGTNSWVLDPPAVECYPIR